MSCLAGELLGDLSLRIKNAAGFLLGSIRFKNIGVASINREKKRYYSNFEIVRVKG